MYGYDSFYAHYLVFYLIYGLIIVVLYNYKSSINMAGGRAGKIIFLALPLYFLGILRGDTVGGDLYYYLSYFDEMCRLKEIGDIWDVSSHEPGYRLFTYLISRISPTHRAFLVGTFTLSFIGPVYLIYKYSKMPFFSFILYYALGFYTNTFNNIRQSIAISICFLAINYLFNRKFRKFLFTVILATTFHYSAIFFLILYPVVNKTITFRKVLVLMGIGVAVYVISRVTILTFLLSLMSYKYNAEAILLESEGGGWSMFIFYLLILMSELFLFLRIKYDEGKKRRLSFCIYLQMFTVLIQLYAPMFASMVRLTYYFYIPIIIVIPMLVREFKSFRPIIIAMGMSMCILFLGMTYSRSETTGSNSQAVIPYVFIDKTIY